VILFKPEHVEPILNGTKYQTRRLGAKRWNVGAIHQCATRLFDPAAVFARVKILNVMQDHLLPISALDAKAEGYDSPEDYIKAWDAINPKAPVNPLVWIVSFALHEVSGG